MTVVKKYSEITHAEWICYEWIDVTEMCMPEPIYLRKGPRPLDKAMELSGGSIKTLKPYLWALDDDKLAG